jgi:D-threo-aldose 1-dehydrogenase
VRRYLAPPYGEKVDYGYWASPLRLKVVCDYSYDGRMRALEQSASRTGLATFDIVYIHDVDRFTHGPDHDKRFDEAMDGCYRALDDLRKAGHVGAVGVGVNESSVATRFVKAGRFDYVMIAGRYSLMDRGAEKDLIPAARERGARLVAAGVFNSDILAAGPKAPTATFDYGPASAEIRARAQTIADLCAAHGVPLLAAAIQFPLRNPLVAAAVLGMSSAERVLENVEASKVSIPPGLWEEVDAAMASAGLS